MQKPSSTSIKPSSYVSDSSRRISKDKSASSSSQARSQHRVSNRELAEYLTRHEDENTTYVFFEYNWITGKSKIVLQSN